MTEPSQQRPVPRLMPVAGASAPEAPPASPESPDAAADRFADLEQRPVAEHVAVFEDEHGRLQRELGTIDQL